MNNRTGMKTLPWGWEQEGPNFFPHFIWSQILRVQGIRTLHNIVKVSLTLVWPHLEHCVQLWDVKDPECIEGGNNAGEGAGRNCLWGVIEDSGLVCFREKEAEG